MLATPRALVARVSHAAGDGGSSGGLAAARRVASSRPASLTLLYVMGILFHLYCQQYSGSSGDGHADYLISER